MRARMREKMLTVAQGMEIVMAVVILAAIVIRAVLLVVGVVQQLGEDSMSFSIDDFLSKVLLIIMGIEFVKMLMLHTYGAVIDVLLFAMARQMIVSHNGPEGTLLSVISVAVIFAIKKFLYTGESWGQKREEPAAVPEDPGPDSQHP